LEVITPPTYVSRERDGRVRIRVRKSAGLAALSIAAAIGLLAPTALAQDPIPTEPVVTEPSPPPPDPDPAPDPPPAAPQPKPKPKAVAPRPAAPAAPSVSRTPSRPSSNVVVPTPSRPSVQRPTRPAVKAKPVVRAKAKRKAKPRVQTSAAVGGGVAGAITTLPSEPAGPLPSELAAAAADTPTSGGGEAPVSLLMTTLIALALGLAALASIPTRQLAVSPATRWIVKRRLDLVIGGMGALAALLGVLFISAVFGP
jgi:hypothetical protein